MGHLDTVKFLVTLPSIEVNTVAVDGSTALGRALWNKQLEVADYLKTVSTISQEL